MGKYLTGQEAIDLIRREAWTGRKPGLSRTRELLRRMGDPHRALKFVHITGTNGKGSTAAMVASILAAAGYRTGLYTSPHLWRFHERFQVNGVPIPDADLGRIAQKTLEAGRGMADPATEFELMTAVGMTWFLEEHCDIVVLEVGLGGRLDSTNVIDAPEAAVITHIGLEHTKELGNTLELIAREKSGIIKPGCDVVLYCQTREVEDVVETACREAGASLTKTSPEALEPASSSLIVGAGVPDGSSPGEGQRFFYKGKGPYSIRLLGEYQLANAATALETAWVLQKRGWRISDEAIRAGLSAAEWPGRMELARRGPDVILDGAHNPQCMEALSGSLARLYPERKVWFLSGVLADKDYPAMFARLLPLAEGFITITPDSPRALEAAALADYLRGRGAWAEAKASVREGLEEVLRLAGPAGVVCICGSLYMIGEARHCLGLC